MERPKLGGACGYYPVRGLLVADLGPRGHARRDLSARKQGIEYRKPESGSECACGSPYL